MRSKVFVLLVALVMVLGVVRAEAATTEDYLEAAGAKLWRGVVNTFTGWVELPAQTCKGYRNGFMGDENNKVCGVVAGLLKGVYHTVGRTMSGVGELVGFWAADPESNDGVGIPLDAEYAWEEGTDYDMYDPNFADATLKPIGDKGLRGLGNTLFGIVEVPGQIVKGIKEGAPDAGIVKGLWYFLSREIGGIFDITTFLLPNPADTKGLAYDEKWPWSALGDSLERPAPQPEVPAQQPEVIE